MDAAAPRSRRFRQSEVVLRPQCWLRRFRSDLFLRLASALILVWADGESGTFRHWIFRGPDRAGRCI